MPHRTDVVACVDGSNYFPSVCEHAVWLRSRCEGRLSLLTVQETHGEALGGAPDAAHTPLLAQAAARIEGFGGEVSATMIDNGVFAERATRFARPWDVLVLGRRGAGNGGDAGVGASVRALIEHTNARLLICGRVYLPIHRALILPPATPQAAFSGFMAGSHILEGLEPDLAIEGKNGLEVKRNGSGVMEPLPEGEYDLVVAARSLLAETQTSRMGQIARATLAGRRLVLVV